MQEITIFSPATVANVSCGFDAMGFALESLGDEMIFKKTEKHRSRIFLKSKVQICPLKHLIMWLVLSRRIC